MVFLLLSLSFLNGSLPFQEKAFMTPLPPSGSTHTSVLSQTEEVCPGRLLIKVFLGLTLFWKFPSQSFVELEWLLGACFRVLVAPWGAWLG